MKKIMMVLSLAFGLTVMSASLNDAAAQSKMSPKKKNTIIGAGAGAATGAIISKKKGKGALIGGAVGAGAGYLWGKHRAKKKARGKA